MRATVILENAKIYDRMDVSSQPVAVLKPGTEFELGKILKSGKDKWVEVVLDNGKKGYIIGTTKIYPVTPIKILSKSARVYKDQDLKSDVRTELKKGDEVDLLNVIKEGNIYWYQVRVKPGTEGYLSRDIKVKPVDLNPRGTARKHILYGLLWLLGAIVIFRMAATGPGLTQQLFSAFLLLLVGAGEVIYGGVRYLQAAGLKKVTMTSPDRKKAVSAKKRSKSKKA